MSTCTCQPDLSGEHDPDCPMNKPSEAPSVAVHDEPTEDWICPECGCVEHVTAHMAHPMHRHGKGGTMGGSGLVWLKKVAA